MRNFRGGSVNRLSNFFAAPHPLSAISVVRSQSPDAKAQKDLEGRRLDEEKVISLSSALALSAIFITPQHIMGFFSTEKHRGVASNESVQRSFPRRCHRRFRLCIRHHIPVQTLEQTGGGSPTLFGRGSKPL